MPREPRGPLPERECVDCGRTYRPRTQPGGGRPAHRCEQCRTTVRTIRPASVAPEADDLGRLVRAARDRSLVAAGVRQRLLDVAHLLDAENSSLANPTLSTCADALREICGYRAVPRAESQHAG